MKVTASIGGPPGRVTCVAGEAFCRSGFSGQIRPGGEHGLFVRDARMLDELVVTVDGHEPEHLGGGLVGAQAARFAAACDRGGPQGPDPRVLVDRRRLLGASMREEVELRNHGREPVVLEVGVVAGTDFASVFTVKRGGAGVRAEPRPLASGLRMDEPDDGLVCEVHADPHPHRPAVDGAMGWTVALAPGERWSLVLEVHVADAVGRAAPQLTWREVVSHGRRAPQRRAPDVRCSDQRMAELAARSWLDLRALETVDAHTGERFLAAGSPWYLTLFGRDSLWAARMALPMDRDLAGSTLRALTARQGSRHDPATEEAPGKILHEVRHGSLADRASLPPVYYGSMDATPLFVVLAEEAWRWGLPEPQVRALLPAVEAALGWLASDDADPDGDGLLEYLPSNEQGLTNQGWKDSFDGVQFADGRLAEPPIALCEVQGYAHDAAVRGARLLEAFGRQGAEGWRRWAAELAARVRERMWVADRHGPYVAVGLDGANRPIDAPASNMGHLLATGVLTAEEAGRVARRLREPDLASGWGLRTMSELTAAYNPLSYHGGAVWPHDTAIAVEGLAVEGQTGAATALLRGLVAAAPHFGYRLPELFAGTARTAGSYPLAYPAACSPQAWAAGAGPLLLRAALGLHPDVPAGRLTLRPMWPPPFRALHVGGVRVGDGELAVTVDRTEGVHVHRAPPGLEVVVEGAPRSSAPLSVARIAPSPAAEPGPLPTGGSPGVVDH